MGAAPELNTVAGATVSTDQRFYLDGFFSGLASRGVTFETVAGAQASDPGDEAPPIREERIKKEEHPLDSFHRLAACARENRSPDRDETFRFKWNGLFFLAPTKNAYMARLKIPGGRVSSHQLRGLANIARELTSGYVQVTTRANLQLRLIEPKDTTAFLRRIEELGLTCRGSGADNIRNLTTNPTAGFDPVELVNCLPIVQELAQFLANHREFYDLPRKFNIAFDGGGLIGSVEDTNDIGVKAVVGEDGPRFRVCVGGATGHRSFASDLGIEVPVREIVDVVVAMVRVYIANGNRRDRKRARLKHLLEDWTLERFLSESERLLGRTLARVPAGAGSIKWPPAPPHSHVGIHPQRQAGLKYLGIALPAGQVTPEQLEALADASERLGQGEVRLTVWQNLIVPGVKDSDTQTLVHEVESAGLGVRQSHLSSGVIACTGNRYCKYAQSDTKGHALALVKMLEGKVPLDAPVNIHFTGCPNSCAQHYMGDIGLLGAKTPDGREAYHVCVGGGFGRSQALGRQIYSSVPSEEVPFLVERMLRAYLRWRAEGESFQAYLVRQTIEQLREAFAG